MKGKSKAEAKSELEKSGMSGPELEKILPHKVISNTSLTVSITVNFIIVIVACQSVQFAFCKTHCTVFYLRIHSL